jgi:hypothetical protein
MALGGEDQMNACRPGLLRQSGDVFFYVAADGHHEIGQFVDDDDNARQPGVHQRRVFDKLPPIAGRRQLFHSLRVGEIDHAFLLPASRSSVRL